MINMVNIIKYYFGEDLEDRFELIKGYIGVFIISIFYIKPNPFLQ